MRQIDKAAIHTKAVEIGRNSANDLVETANRLAIANVDKAIIDILSHLRESAWELPDQLIIEGCAIRLWTEWCAAELKQALGE